MPRTFDSVFWTDRRSFIENFYSKFFFTLLENKFLFCSTGLPLANIIWVRSTFFSHCPISSNKRCWLTSATSGMLRIEPRAAGSVGEYASQCAMLPPAKITDFYLRRFFDQTFVLAKLITFYSKVDSISRFFPLILILNGFLLDILSDCKICCTRFKSNCYSVFC